MSNSNTQTTGSGMELDLIIQQIDKRLDSLQNGQAQQWNAINQVKASISGNGTPGLRQEVAESQRIAAEALTTAREALQAVRDHTKPKPFRQKLVDAGIQVAVTIVGAACLVWLGIGTGAIG